MKAAMGLLSDTVPIFGYHKRSYIVLVSIIGSISFAVLGFVHLKPSGAPFAAFLLLIGNLEIAMVDLLCEGKYAEMMVAKPESGSMLVTFVWGMNMAGSFAGSIVAGPMADHLDARYIFLVCFPLAAQVIYPTLSGWMPEERLPPDQRGIRKDKITAHPNLFRLSILMTLGATAVGMSALVGSGSTQSLVSIVAALILCVLGLRWLPRMLGKANLYMFLSSMTYVSLPGALDYWFTAEPSCVPDGPHFSFTYYVTYASLVGAVAGAIGVSMFQTFLSRGTFRRAFWVTSVVKLVASIFDILLVERVNKRFGISDRVAFMLGDAILYQVALMLDLMPAVVLTSKVCPKGMEASVYALLASYQNIGSAVSRTLGVALIDHLGIKTTEPCDFTNLSMAIVIAHVALPLVIFPLVFVLIPDAKMTEDLLGEDADEGGASDFVRVPAEDPDDNDSTDGDKSLENSDDKEQVETASSERSLAIDVKKAQFETNRASAGDEIASSSAEISVLSITPGTAATVTAGEDELPSSMIEYEDAPVHNNETSDSNLLSQRND